MQWDDRPNAGFSSVDADLLYLPIDPDPGRPNVAAQRADPYSTLNFVRDLLALRASTPALRTDASTRVINAGYPFAYLRGDSHLVVINPTRMPLTLTPGEFRVRQVLMARDCQVDGDVVALDAFGFGIFEILPKSAGAPDPTKPPR
jgi:maltose alpha-D-glucosyltransferase/alpha-amylase